MTIFLHKKLQGAYSNTQWFLYIHSCSFLSGNIPHIKLECSIFSYLQSFAKKFPSLYYIHVQGIHNKTNNNQFNSSAIDQVAFFNPSKLSPKD